MGLLERSFFASVIIFVVIACRILLINKLPKRVFLVLWYVVLLRLLLPYSFSSVCSIYSLKGQGMPIVNRMENTEENKDRGSYKEIQKKKEEIKNKNIKNADSVSIEKICKIIWLVGIGFCAAAFLTAYMVCYRKFNTSLPVKNTITEKWLKSHKIKRRISIRQTDGISSPLTYGIFRPVILVPKKTEWEKTSQIEYMLEHELIHIKRLDAITKLCFIVAVCIYWFHPLVWIMYIFVNRDIELSCDEAVVRHFGEGSKSAYALALIEMEETKSNLMPLGSGFNKNATEERITAIMKIRKNTIVSYFMAAVLVVGIIIVFAASPMTADKSQKGGSDEKTEKQDKNYNREKEEEEKERIEEENPLYDSVLGEIAAGIAKKGDYEALEGIIYLLSEKDVNKIVEYIVENEDWEALKYLFPYISKKTLEEIGGLTEKQKWGNVL